MHLSNPDVPSFLRPPRLAAQQCCAGGFRGEAGSAIPEVPLCGGAEVFQDGPGAVVMVLVAAA